MHPNEIKLTDENVPYLMAEAITLSGNNGPHMKALDEQAGRQSEKAK